MARYRDINLKPFKNPVFVSRPTLPKHEEFCKKSKEIFESEWLTNFGKQHGILKNKLKNYLENRNLSLFCNGTIALDVGIKALDISGEVITTPFTFAATPHALSLNNIKPVFCDIEEKTLNIDPDKIESLITKKTSAILAVHVFGNPCDTKKIEKIAKKHGLKVIYDAAHAFGVKIDNIPVGNFGDMSIFSFHATKIFNTAEGGCLVYKNSNLSEKLYLLKNFGIKNEDEIELVGTNAKMNEIQAAIGILNLKTLEKEIAKRRKLEEIYKKELSKINGLSFLGKVANVKYNYSYFPILIDKMISGLSRDELYSELKKYNIFARKYFYPLCNNFSCYKNSQAKKTPVAEKISKQVLIMPLYGRLKSADVKKICLIVKSITDNAEKK